MLTPGPVEESGTIAEDSGLGISPEDLADSYARQRSRDETTAFWLNSLLTNAKKDRERFHQKWISYIDAFRSHFKPSSTNSQVAPIFSNQLFRIISTAVPLIADGRIRGEIIALERKVENQVRALNFVVAAMQEEADLDMLQADVWTDGLMLGTGVGKYFYDIVNDRHRLAWVDTFNVFPDQWATSPDNLRVLFVRHVMPLAEAKARWPEHSEEIQSESVTGSTDTTGLFRPKEALPSKREASTVSRGTGRGYEEVWSKGNIVGGTDEETHVYECWVDDQFARAALDPLLDVASGKNAADECREEELMMATGVALGCRPEDDDISHIVRHSQSLKTTLRDRPIEQIVAIQKHLEAHKQRLQQIPEESKRLYPGGWRVYFLHHNTLCEKGGSPIQDRQIPYAFFRNSFNPGEFWGMAEMQSIEALQAFLNHVNTATCHTSRLNALRPLMADQNLKIANTAFATPFNAVYRVDFSRASGDPIRWMQPAQVTGDMLRLSQLITSEILDTAGVSSMLEGVPPAAGMSGIALGVVKESSLTRTRQRVRAAISFMTQLVRALAAGIKVYWRDAREIRVRTSTNTTAGQPEGMLPSLNPGYGYLSINTPSPEGGMLNDIAEIDLDSVGIRVSASGTLPFGKLQRVEELFRMFENHIIDMQAMRQALVALGTMEEGTAIEMAQREMPPASGAPGSPPPGAPSMPPPPGGPGQELLPMGVQPGKPAPPRGFYQEKRQGAPSLMGMPYGGSNAPSLAALMGAVAQGPAGPPMPIPPPNGGGKFSPAWLSM